MHALASLFASLVTFFGGALAAAAPPAPAYAPPQPELSSSYHVPTTSFSSRMAVVASAAAAVPATAHDTAAASAATVHQAVASATKNTRTAFSRTASSVSTSLHTIAETADADARKLVRTVTDAGTRIISLVGKAHSALATDWRPPERIASQNAAASLSDTPDIATSSARDTARVPVTDTATVATTANSPPVRQTTTYIIEQRPAQSESGVSPLVLATLLANFQQKIDQKLAALPAPVTYAPAFSGGGSAVPAYTQTWGLTQRIDSLTNTTITNPAITGGSISGASVSGYLPTSGGSISGGLTLSGALTAGAFNASSITSVGALIGPYFTATSTTATSSFASGFSISGYASLATTTITGGLTVNGNTNITEGGQLTVGDKIIAPGEIGLGTSTPYAKLALQSTDASQTALAVWGASAQTSPLVDIFSSAGANFLRVTSAGNVGIGTSTPGSLLSLGGIANFTTATSTFYSTGGINLAGGCFAVNGTCIGGISTQWTTSGSTISYATGNVGIGTTTPWGRLSVTNTGSGPSFVVEDSTSPDTTPFIIDASGNAGIGTASPVAKLDVDGGASAGTAVKFYNSTLGGFLFKVNDGADSLGYGASYRHGIFVGANESLALLTNGSSVPKMVIKTDGNVGIGTTTPWGRLSVAGSGTGSGIAFATADSSNSPKFVVQDNGYVGVGTMYPTKRLTVLGSTSGDVTDMRVGQTTGYALKLGYYFSTGVGVIQAVGGSDAINVYARLALQPDGGKVGIGTVTPYAGLSIWGSSSTAGNAFEIANSASTTILSVSNAGLVSIGSGSGASSGIFTVDASSSTTTISNLSVGNLVFDTNAGAVNLSDLPVDSSLAAGVVESQSISIGGTPVFTIYGEADGSGGIKNTRIGVNVTNPTYVIDAASSTSIGPVARFTNATGNCTIDPTNTALSCSSDERLKTNILTLDAPTTLDSVLGLRPVTYNWTSEATGTPAHTGFIAQEVRDIFPNLVSADGNGYLTLNYAGFVPYIVAAVQTIVHDIAAWTERFTTRQLCLADTGGTTCITRAQLDALLASPGQALDGGTGQAPAGTPPSIELLGNDPAAVSVGATYVDPGATVHDVAYPGIGYAVSLDGGATTTPESLQLDTSTPGDHVIEFSLHDPSGASARATRTVHVIAPEADGATTTPDAGTTGVDTATSTAASTTP